MEITDVIIRQASMADCNYAVQISEEMEASARVRGTGIGKRSPDAICQKMAEGNAVIAFTKGGQWVGYIYLEVYAHARFVSHCGLIVAPEWRRLGVATQMKECIFWLTRKKYPLAKIFGITTTLATMRINSKLGLQPVTFSEITADPSFWKKCEQCVNYQNLKNTNFRNCYCTAMMFDPDIALNVNKL
ncbi:MAG: GNAT family N-acetyltransferase [Sphingobacterium sp.]|jgi:GNAT superfamily N-acetyltransferase|nr:GNAT family N-acetyltransferase [Sphingobacterium sp.]